MNIKEENKKFLEEHPEMKLPENVKNSRIELAWPYNLISDMLNRYNSFRFRNNYNEKEKRQKYEYIYNWANNANDSDLEDRTKGIEYAIDNVLTQAQAAIVFKRCKEYLTFVEIAKICDRSNQRITQLYNSAMSKIWRCVYVQYGYENYKKREAEEAKQEQDTLANSSNANMFAFKNYESIDILNLSTMAFNNLKRSGIKTIGTLKYLSVQDLLKIRIMGKKTATEICEKMEKCCGWYMVETPEERNTYIVNRAYFDTLNYLRDKSDEEVIDTPVGIYGHQICNDIGIVSKYVNFVKNNISYTYNDLPYFLRDYAGSKVYITPNNTLWQFLAFFKKAMYEGRDDIYYNFKYNYNNPLVLAGAIEDDRCIYSSGAKFIGFYRAVRDVFALRNIKIDKNESSNAIKTADHDEDILNNKDEYIDAVIRQIEHYHEREDLILNQLNGEIEECKKYLNRIDTIYKALEDVRSDIKRNEDMLRKALK